MNRKQEKDEHLERLWHMKEEGEDSIDRLRSALLEDFNTDIIDELSSEGLVDLNEENKKIALTRKGEDVARQLIRAHRLAERLLHDVLGGDFEPGACEFEHTVTPELIDSICILLGHPKECPHGLPIPEGECCRRSLRTTQSSVIPLTELEVGQSGRIAYVNCRDDRQLHKIDGLHIRPGTCLKLHQIYPSYVIECEGANIALDKEIASNICVWKDLSQCQPTGEENVVPIRRVRGWGRGFMFRRRRGHE